MTCILSCSGCTSLQFKSEAVFSLFRTKKRSAVELWSAERSNAILHTLNLRKNIDGTEVLKLKCCHLNMVQASLRAIVGQKVGRSYVLDVIHDQGRKKGHIVFFLKGSTEIRFKLHYRNKQGIVTLNDGHLICEVTQLVRYCFRYWTDLVLNDAPYQQWNLNSDDIFCFPKFTQRFKLMLFVQLNHGRSFVENARKCQRDTITLIEKTRQ